MGIVGLLGLRLTRLLDMTENLHWDVKHQHNFLKDVFSVLFHRVVYSFTGMYWKIFS